MRIFLVPLLLLPIVSTGCAKPGVLIVRDKAGLALDCKPLGEVTDGTLVGPVFGTRPGEGAAVRPLVEQTRERGGTHLLVEGRADKEPIPNVGTAFKCPGR